MFVQTRQGSLHKKEVIRLDKEDCELPAKILLGLGVFCVAIGILGLSYFGGHGGWLGLALLILGIAVVIVVAYLNKEIKDIRVPVPP